MKKLLWLLPLFALVWSCTPGGSGSGASGSFTGLNNMTDSASYSQGVMMGKQVKDLQIEGEDPIINSDAWKAGLDAGMTGGTPIMKEEEMQKVMTAFQMKMQAAAQKEAMAASAKNVEIGNAFLAENGTKEGVVTTASGLQYKVMTPGTGATPTAADRVSVEYEGRLIDGTVFDSSAKTGKPAQFGVGGVIRGWTEALQLMKEGAKYQLYIPAQLAYGERGSPPAIKPGMTLIFDVELVEILK